MNNPSASHPNSKTVRNSPPISKHVFLPQNAGIGGITRNLQAKQQLIDHSMKESFRDLDSLMENAQDMVALASQIALAKGTSSAEEVELHDTIIYKMGILNPVTRNMHRNGGTYFDELAREIDEFLSQRIWVERKEEEMDYHHQSNKDDNKSSIVQSILTLTDLYCFLNCARGVALLSPEDLLKACRRLEPLGLGSRLIQPCRCQGLLAVVSTQYDEYKMLQSVAEAIQCENDGISAARLATKRSLPLALSQYYLTQAEEQELLCRDESSEGLFFWYNIFTN